MSKCLSIWCYRMSKFQPKRCFRMSVYKMFYFLVYLCLRSIYLSKSVFIYIFIYIYLYLACTVYICPLIRVLLQDPRLLPLVAHVVSTSGLRITWFLHPVEDHVVSTSGSGSRGFYIQQWITWFLHLLYSAAPFYRVYLRSRLFNNIFLCSHIV